VRAMRILSVPLALTRSVEKFRGCFSSPQFAHFQAYLLGLILGLKFYSDKFAVLAWQ